jgi:dipeptidase E
MKLPSRILLISNSTVHSRGYLDHVADRITTFLGSAKHVLFFPFALFDRHGYANTARTRFAAMGYSLESAHAAPNPRKAVEQTDAIFIGGGNTFRLLKALQDLDLLEPIRRRVKNGTPYIGSSAGSNVAGPTIKTTEDMPIVQPRSFDSLGLVPFQISPHYLDPDPTSKHMGETQEERHSPIPRRERNPRRGHARRILGCGRERHRNIAGPKWGQDFSPWLRSRGSNPRLGNLGISGNAG